MISARGFDLQAAAGELARIAEAYDAALRDGVGVLVLRNTAGELVALGVCEDVEAGQIVELELPPAPAWAERLREDDVA